ncbi:hypothetical protein [Caulobacter sp. DWR1-3-2b1]|uniref:hypothetical protein n=1 Tax=Caulobacter sp. DWR1-3-2b1 TaxID=2804670 RepID=UPI003CF8DBC2
MHKALVAGGFAIQYSSLYAWRRGSQSPRNVESLRAISFVERRYGLGAGELKDKLSHRTRAAFGHRVTGASDSERRRLAWHLPDDFNQRGPEERAEILHWVRTVILAGSTTYRRYQNKAQQYAFGVGFSASALDIKKPYAPNAAEMETKRATVIAGLDRTPACPGLDGEMADLLRFKSADVTRFGFRRVGVWGNATIRQKADHLGLLFGALAASPNGPIKGLGVPSSDLSFALLSHPKVWNWYVEWRRARRGFLTNWEADMLTLGASMMRRETGWLRQSPDLAERLRPIQGLFTIKDVARAQSDWDAFCDDGYASTHAWSKEVKRAARIHRDPFEPILPALDAESPVGVYLQIPQEILRQMPDVRRHPVAAAEAVRAFLMLRWGCTPGYVRKI